MIKIVDALRINSVERPIPLAQSLHYGESKRWQTTSRRQSTRWASVLPGSTFGLIALAKQSDYLIAAGIQEASNRLVQRLLVRRP
jgi:hypothetical protein